MWKLINCRQLICVCMFEGGGKTSIEIIIYNHLSGVFKFQVLKVFFFHFKILQFIFMENFAVFSVLLFNCCGEFLNQIVEVW